MQVQVLILHGLILQRAIFHEALSMKPMGNVAKFGTLLHFCHIYLAGKARFFLYLVDTPLEAWYFSYVR